ncbi:hypothetical protein JCM5350_002750 [Sporobolomyces pararoseus]
MCLAQAALVYVLTVRSSSLLFAADAWSRLKFSLPFFQLIYLRRRKGGLATSGSQVFGPVTQVPDEIWEQIRLSLIQQELIDSETRFLEPLLCTSIDCGIKSSTRAGIRWELLKNKQRCDDCDVNGIGLFTRSTIANWHGLEAWEETFTLEALVLIGAPTTFETGSSETTEITASCGGHYAHDESTIIEASFKLPRGIKTRFERLIEMFGLKVVYSSINKLLPRRASTGRKEEAEQAQLSGVENRATNKIRPRWKLWMMCKYTT